MKRINQVVSKILILLFVFAVPGIPTYLYFTGDVLQRSTVAVFAFFGQDSWTEEDELAMANIEKTINQFGASNLRLERENEMLRARIHWLEREQRDYLKKQADLVTWAFENDKLETLAYVKRRFGARIEKAAKKYGVKPELITAVISVEWDKRNLNSKKGARGPMQLMPRTAKKLGVNPDHEFENILGGAKYLAILNERFSSLSLAIAAYNAGPTIVAKLGEIPPYDETIDYVHRVKFLMSLA